MHMNPHRFLLGSSVHPPVRRRGVRRAAAALLLAASFNMAAAAGLSILSPSPKETVHDNAGNVHVVVGIEDGAVLPPGYNIRLLLDGEPAAPDERDTRFQLEGLDRGEHRLSALIVDDEGRVLTQSEPVVFFVWQASRLAPRGP